MKLRPYHAPRFLTVQPHEPEATTLPVLGFRQARDYACGFATALMVMRYFDVRVPARELFERLGTDRGGTRQTAIVRELRITGLRANVRYDVDFERLARAIDRNKLIVGYLHDIEHWLVVYGYGRGPERVFVADPRPDAGPCVQPWADYRGRLNGFGIVCSRPGQERGVGQAPLILVDEPAPQPLLPRAGGRLQCRVHGVVEGPVAVPAEPAQLALPFA
ncbi:cysteine peptidase family C39 domain-containing protein [Haliangium sp.]|uniref:cysteine peptidase family C39 domain-containing protein n=1 Tax=Haliangium sp. TaxID=2663208 RepID=UPI003D11CBF7